MLEAINSSALTKLMAIIFIFLSLVTCLFVIAIYLVMYQKNPPDYINNVVYAGLAASINMLGVHLGAVTQSNGATQAISLPIKLGEENAKKS